MDSLVAKAKTYAEILRDCSLPQVADWKIVDVERAHQWAEYFQRVHQRTADKPSTVSKLDTKFRDIGRELGVRFGEEELSYDFLSHSADYFTKCLLDNPALPEELREEICAISPDTTQRHIEDKQSSRLMLDSLRRIAESLAPYLGEEDLLKDLKSLDAEYLRKDIAWLLKKQQAESEEHTSVHRRLCKLAKVEGGMEVILTSLLQDTADCSCLTPAPTHLNSLDTVRRTILDWLLTVVASQTAKSDSRAQDIQEEDVTDIADTLWHSDHSKLLAQVSARYLDFFKAYFQMLATRTREIEKRRLESCILQTSDVEPNEEIPLSQRIEWATCHWVELAQAGAHLKDICEAFLLKETQQPISEAESTYWTMSMRVTVSRESLWYKLLAAMHSVHQI